VCEPSKKEAVVIPDQDKGGVLMQTYYKGYSNFWTGRQYVLEYEEVGGDIELPPQKHGDKSYTLFSTA
jgi:hypothetical protein